MQIEREGVEATVRARGLRYVRVVQTGIGKDAIVRSLEHVLGTTRGGAGGAGVEPARCAVILAGACGGLGETHDVPAIARVIDEHGGGWTPRLGAHESGVTLIAVDRVVATPDQKRALALRTGAAIVDMESHAFAARCEHLGVAWGIVRGVSDTPDETLPGEVLSWITPEGGTRTVKAALDLARKPSLVPHVVGVMRRARRVMPQVGARVCELAEHARGWAERTKGAHA